MLLIQVFITDHENAIEELCGQSAKDSRKFDSCLQTMATRIATVFASLKVHNLIETVLVMILQDYTCVYMSFFLPNECGMPFFHKVTLVCLDSTFFSL